jgi:hypothetical protein
VLSRQSALWAKINFFNFFNQKVYPIPQSKQSNVESLEFSDVNVKDSIRDGKALKTAFNPDLAGYGVFNLVRNN